jgi:hypothetical protein
MSLDNTSHPGRPGLDELVPSRYALKVGAIEVLVVSDGVLSLPSAMLGHNVDPAVRAAWLEDMREDWEALFRRARRPVLLHRARPGPAPMGRRRHVSADRHATAPRRRAAQLPADGVVAGSRDGRGGPVTLGRTHPLLRHVDRVRGPHGELRPYGPRPARRDGHVRRWLVTCARRQEAIGQSDIGLFFC